MAGQGLGFGPRCDGLERRLEWGVVKQGARSRRVEASHGETMRASARKELQRFEG